MAESVHKALKHRYNGRSHILQTNSDAAIRSMELMRMNIQDAFDREVDTIVKKYIDVLYLNISIKFSLTYKIFTEFL